jgi:hypothetical protein
MNVSEPLIRRPVMTAVLTASRAGRSGPLELIAGWTGVRGGRGLQREVLAHGRRAVSTETRWARGTGGCARRR